MAFINWTEELSVNVKEIDLEHKKLVNMLNTLHSALVDRKGQAVQKSIVLEMVDYASFHFATEEKYMLRFNFPGYQEHKEEHEQFTEKALNLKARIEKFGSVLTLEILNFLRDWLKKHILGTDKKYSKFFNEHGLY